MGPSPPSPLFAAGDFGSLHCLGRFRHNNQEEMEQEGNPAEKSGKVKTGARCLSGGKLIVFLWAEQSAVSPKIIIDTSLGCSGDFWKKKSCGGTDWKLFFLTFYSNIQQVRKKLLKATMPSKPKHSPWVCKRGLFFFFFCQWDWKAVINDRHLLT